MNRIGLFGGSFDPVHLGHLLVAQAACEEFKLDRLFFIPADLDLAGAEVEIARMPDHLTRLAQALSILRLDQTFDFMLIDWGADHGVTPGTRLAIYRDVRTPGLPLASVGDAVVISVGPMLSLTRITRARDAVQSGDYVAIRK